ncbi:hypothetical protein [uncultured Salinicola sp.]|uniref:hypothetical protein n=1 Tax=uncultured Salinicola sp. TaxID=1193542 RepID=UPI0026097BFE|nr:hypothetical protein [uncultured Salinicola sp.]|tara:strand:+ start:2175 stop:2564 length:390 start_codon:yes stop_codon:yes gene_type:complete
MNRFKANANVILTYEGEDADGNSQEFYDAEIDAAYPADEADLQRFEIDVIKDVLAPSSRDKGDLVKISLCYDGSNPMGADDREIEKRETMFSHLCRNNAKYYFQPNQRDDSEQAIVDELGVAGRTKDFE